MGPHRRSRSTGASHPCGSARPCGLSAGPCPPPGIPSPATIARATGGSGCTRTRRATARPRSACSARDPAAAAWRAPSPPGTRRPWRRRSSRRAAARPRCARRRLGPPIRRDRPSRRNRSSPSTRDRLPPAWAPRADRPLSGLRVLDLTRVLAGPVATRFLAGYGAEVLRIDPPDWNEPGSSPR